jgi:hypothetical protein
MPRKCPWLAAAAVVIPFLQIGASMMPTSATAQAGVDTTWQIENVALRVTIEPETGHMSVLQKATGTLWEQELPLPDPHSVSDLEADTHPSVLRYSLTIVHGQPQPLELTIELALIGDEPALEITLASGAGDQVNMRHFGYPAPLYPPKPESYFLAMPEFGNGRYVPVSDDDLPPLTVPLTVSWIRCLQPCP